MALAQLLKRIGHDACTRFAGPRATYGDRGETDAMWSVSISWQRTALRRAEGGVHDETFRP